MISFKDNPNRNNTKIICNMYEYITIMVLIYDPVYTASNKIICWRT